METLVGEVREGDGVDPREEAKRRRRPSSDAVPGEGSHQQERFASQIQTTVELALEAAATPILNALTVHDVVPQGNALVVVLVPRDSAEELNLQEAGAAVTRAAAMLRREVSAAITRKETPNLRFIVLPAGTREVSE